MKWVPVPSASCASGRTATTSSWARSGVTRCARRSPAAPPRAPSFLLPAHAVPAAGQGSRNRAGWDESSSASNIPTRRPGMTVRLIALLLLATLAVGRAAGARRGPGGGRCLPEGQPFRRRDPIPGAGRLRVRPGPLRGDRLRRADLGGRQGDDGGPRRPRDGRDQRGVHRGRDRAGAGRRLRARRRPLAAPARSRARQRPRLSPRGFAHRPRGRPGDGRGRAVRARVLAERRLRQRPLAAEQRATRPFPSPSSSRPTPRSIPATPAARCSTWRATSSGS